jgi:hypothetical protein
MNGYNGLYNIAEIKRGGLLRMTTASGPVWSGTATPTWRTNWSRQSTGSGTLDSPLCPLVLFPRPDDSRPMMPVNVYGEHSPAQVPAYFLYGAVPNLRAISFPGLLAAQELAIGAETWMAFPLQGANPAVTAVSQQFGMALKKVS